MSPRPLHIRLLRGLGFAAILFWSAFPIALVVASSFKPARDIFVYPPAWLFTPTLANYQGLWVRWPDFLRNMVNSGIVTLGATVLAVLSSALAGYVYSRFRSRVLTLTAFFMIFVRMFPRIVITLPRT